MIARSPQATLACRQCWSEIRSNATRVVRSSHERPARRMSAAQAARRHRMILTARRYAATDLSRTASFATPAREVRTRVLLSAPAASSSAMRARLSAAAVQQSVSTRWSRCSTAMVAALQAPRRARTTIAAVARPAIGASAAGRASTRLGGLNRNLLHRLPQVDSTAAMASSRYAFTTAARSHARQETRARLMDGKATV